MSANKLLAVAFAAMVVSTSGHAQQVRSVEHFITHPQERRALDGICSQGLLRTVQEVECAHAIEAGNWMLKAEAEALSRRGGVGSVTSPAYFDRFPIARLVTLKECNNPVSFAVRPSQAQCRAASLSQMGVSR